MSLSAWIVIFAIRNEAGNQLLAGTLIIIFAVVQLVVGMVRHIALFGWTWIGWQVRICIDSCCCGAVARIRPEDEMQLINSFRMMFLTVVDFGFDLIVGLAYTQDIDNITDNDVDAGTVDAILIVGSALGAAGQLYEFFETVIVYLDKAADHFCSKRVIGSYFCCCFQFVCGITETSFMFYLVITTDEDKHAMFMGGAYAILIMVSLLAFVFPLCCGCCCLCIIRVS